MVNYREIFNPSYNILGLIIVIILISLIILINKDLLKAINSIGKSLLTGGLITLIVILLISLISNLIVSSKYQVFLDIIMNNVQKNTIFYSSTCIVIGGIMLLITYISKKKEKL